MLPFKYFVMAICNNYETINNSCKYWEGIILRDNIKIKAIKHDRLHLSSQNYKFLLPLAPPHTHTQVKH